jgi:FPC/CPF motif-containing protein YcgG
MSGMTGARSTHRGDLLARVHDPSFPCLGAKAAAKRGLIHTQEFKNLLVDPSEIRDLAASLEAFVDEYSSPRSEFAVLVTIDVGTKMASETEFETYLWGVLQKVHELDAAEWDPKYSTDPHDASFKFSFGGRAFYVVGLSPTASRVARRFSYPTIVFNPVWQFERLREVAQLEGLIDRIRSRDARLQGSINPNLEFEGIRSDALQYSGRRVDASWQCPFRLKESS